MSLFWDVDFRVNDGRVWTVSVLRPGDERAAIREAERFCHESAALASDTRTVLRETIRPAPDPAFPWFGDDPLTRRSTCR